MKDKKRILITGASGLIGSRLTTLLLEKGYEVRHLSRSAKGNVPTFVWDVDKQTMQAEALAGVDAVIHLAGANVAEKRWTKERKKEILDSRVKSTQVLAKYLANAVSVKTVISASAIGFYGFNNPNKIFNEDNKAGTDFLAQVTERWENEIDKIGKLNIRLVKMRIGIVLAKEGGALQPITKTINSLIGAPLGSGDQFMSWIHIDDVCQMFIHCLENDSISGAVNTVAPGPVTNRQLTKAIAQKLHKPLVLPPVPAFVLRIALGEMADIVLQGSKVSPKKILNTGYKFKFPDLDSALNDLLKN